VTDTRTPPVADRCGMVQRSPIRAIFEIAERMTDVIRLEVGEPDFRTPDAILEAGRAAIAQGKIGYTAMTGNKDLREAIAARYASKFNLAVDPDSEILVTAGGAPALHFSLMVTANPGDEVLVPDPGFPNYRQVVKLLGCTPVLYPLREDPVRGFQLDPEAIRHMASPRTRAIIVNSPSNPTGGVIALEEARELGRIAEELDLTVISDEVYDALVYDGFRHVCLATIEGFAGRTITVGSASKTYAMTGWRIGYALAPAPILKYMATFQSLIDICANRISQVAYKDALSGVADDAVDAMREEFVARRDLVVAALNAIPGIHCPKPLGAFYAFANISELGMADVDFAREFLMRHKVTSVPGSGFGPNGEGHLRFSYASSQANLAEGMKRLAVFAAEVREGLVVPQAGD
jgi:aminotransferase